MRCALSTHGMWLVVLLAGGLLETTAHAAGMWEASFEAAQEKSKQTQQPILLHFYADWCGPCKTMESTVFVSPEFQAALKGQVIGVKVNGDFQSHLKSRFGITAYPADVLLSPDGQELGRNVGSKSTRDYLAFLDKTAPKAPQPKQQTSDQPAPKPEATVLSVKRSDLGLDGYSPVALSRESRWVRGDSKHQAQHLNMTYHFTSAEEREAFLGNPDHFAPQYLECDPVALAEFGEANLGQRKFGAVYRGRLYFMATAETQAEFLKSPELYWKLDYRIVLEPKEQLVQGNRESAE